MPPRRSDEGNTLIRAALSNLPGAQLVCLPTLGDGLVWVGQQSELLQSDARLRLAAAAAAHLLALRAVRGGGGSQCRLMLVAADGGTARRQRS